MSSPTLVLLSGLVGALSVFLMGVVREWWREERELCGLLRLLLSEIEHNAEVVRTVGEETWDLLSSPDLPSLTTETWRDVQGRAAALLPGDLSVPLNGYYSALQTLLTLLAFKKSANERANRGIRRAYSELTGKEVVGARNPWDEYLGATLDAQTRTRDRILVYLALRPGERLLLRVSNWAEERRSSSRS